MRQWCNRYRKLDEQIQTCLDAGLTDVRVSGQRSRFTGEIDGWRPVVGGTGADPADGQSHRIVVRSGAYAFVDVDCEDDERAGDEGGYAIGDFEPPDEAAAWISNSFGKDDEETYRLLTLDRFLEEVASPGYWREVFALVYDLGLAADDAMEQELNRFRSAALSAVVDQASTVAAHPVLTVDAVDRAWEEFREAVDRRAPYAGFMVVETEFYEDVWLAFGHNRGMPNEVLYCARGTGSVSLNGIHVRSNDYEAEIAQSYEDPWARSGARLAARDLIAIYGAIHRVIDAERRHAEHLAYLEEATLRTNVYLKTPGADEALEANRPNDVSIETFYETLDQMNTYMVEKIDGGQT